MIVDTSQLEMMFGISSGSQARVGFIGIKKCSLLILECEIGFVK